MSGTVGLERPKAIGAWLRGVFWGVGAARSPPAMLTFADMVVWGVLRSQDEHTGDDKIFGRRFIRLSPRAHALPLNFNSFFCFYMRLWKLYGEANESIYFHEYRWQGGEESQCDGVPVFTADRVTISRGRGGVNFLIGLRRELNCQRRANSQPRVDGKRAKLAASGLALDSRGHEPDLRRKIREGWSLEHGDALLV